MEKEGELHYEICREKMKKGWKNRDRAQ